VDGAGTYTVTVTNPVNNCVSTATFTVTGDTIPPDVTTTPLGVITCTTTTVQVQASSSDPNVTFAWFGSGLISGTNTATPTVDGANGYLVVATNPVNQCQTMDTVYVTEDVTPPNVN